MKRSCSFLLCLIMFSGISLVAQTFELVNVSEISTQAYSSSFPSEMFADIRVKDEYRYCHPESQSLRVMAIEPNMGVADTKAACFDLLTGKSLWQWNLDSFIVQFIQGEKAVFILTLTSLYSIEINTGKLQWQLDLKSSTLISPIKVSRNQIRKAWPNSNAMKQEFDLHNKLRPSFVFFPVQNSLILSYGDGRLDKIDIVSGIKSSSWKAPSGTTSQGLAASDQTLWLVMKDRGAYALTPDLQVKAVVYLAEPFVKTYTSYQAVFGTQDALIARTHDAICIWNASTSTVSVQSLYTGKNGFFRIDESGYFGWRDQGLFRMSLQDFKETGSFAGSEVTIWVGLIPLTGSQAFVLYPRYLLNGFAIRPIWQGKSILMLRDSDLKPLQELTIPNFTTDSAQQMLCILRGANVPPYWDSKNSRVYMVVSTITDTSLSQTLQPNTVKDLYLTISWKD